MENFIIRESQYLTKELAEILNTNIFSVPNWKWLVLLFALAAGLITRPVIQFVYRKIKEHNPFLKKFPQSFIAHLLEQDAERPLAWLTIILFWITLVDAVSFNGKIEVYLNNFLHALFAIYLIRILYLSAEAVGRILTDFAAKTESTYDDQLVPFATKTMKVLVVLLGALVVLQNFGLNVMSLIAGLGLGGLALALAAQDTAANLFGSITILIDHPFKIGDWVKIKDMEGTVEAIGFRSTRVRTFYNSLITIPNAMMAKETIDNMGERPLRRIRQVLGVTYNTPGEKIEQFCDQVRYLLRQHPKVHPDTITVQFNNFGHSSLDVLVNFHLQASTGAEELQMQQVIFLEILNIASQIRVEFAYPTQTVFYKNLP